MISVFTPSHNPKWLDECYRSLFEQTNPNWEWIVVLNGDAKWKAPDDARIKTYRLEGNRGVGYYKREAVNWCTGDIILELDHDDYLLPDALSLVEWVFDRYPNVGFVYSDCAQINEDGTPNDEEFDPFYGWTYYTQDGFKVANSFEPHPHNVGYIWYAPNHLRAFRYKAYRDIAGYDPNLYICDDQDLMSRLYKETEFYHIKECLYLQRIHGENTQSKPDINPQIQSLTVDLYQRDIQQMAVKWADSNDLLSLDLGSYHNKAEGFLGVDLRPGPGVDIVDDFLDLDLAPNSVGVIRAHDFMEHIENKIAFIEKAYELLAHGGMLLSMTPSTDGRGAFQDPTHVAFYNEHSFWYYTDKNYANFIDTYVRFQVSTLRTFFPSQWHAENNVPYVQANLIALKAEGRDFGGLLSI